MQRRAERLVRAHLCCRAANRIERVDIAGALPEHADLRVADQARIYPVLDIAVAAAHLHRAGRHAKVVAARAELEERSEDAQQMHRALIGVIGAVHHISRPRVHRERLLRRHHQLEQLTVHERHFDQSAAKRDTVASHA